MLSRPDHEMVVDGIKIPLEVRGYSAPPPDTSESASSEVPIDSVDLLSVCEIFL